ncbi:MAG: oligosaccharide flippase family protein [Paludibacteraceae bacterium]|nr:oligosaccharide flippase family protein [Paludibacteraceae bacterium]
MNKYLSILKSNLSRIRNVSLYFSASLIQGLVSLAINPLIAMNMSYYDYALTGFFTSFNSLILPLLSLMFGQYFNKHYFKLNSEEERNDLAAKVVSTRLIFNLFEIVFILMVFYLYAKIQNIEFPVYPYAIITFSTIIFNNIYDFYLLKLKMGKKASSFFKISIINSVLLSGLLLLLVVGFKLGGLGKLLASLVTSVILCIYLLPKITKKLILDKKIFLDALKFCWPLILAAASGYFLRGFDRALLVNLNDTVQLGLYNVAISISGYLAIFQTSIGNTFQPDIFEAVAKNNKKKLITIIGGINLLNLIPIIIFIAFAPFITKILTAGRFTDAYTYARILALNNVSMTLAYTSMSSIFIAKGYTFLSMTSEVIGAILSIVMFKIMIDKYNFYGAAWGQVISYFLIFIIGILSYFLYKKFFNKPIKR